MPFAFGIDENGNYGYIKDGADSVTPFKGDFTCTIPLFGCNSWYTSNQGPVTVFVYTNDKKYKYLKATSSNGGFASVVYGDNKALKTLNNKTTAILEIENISKIKLMHSVSGVANDNITLIFTDNA